MGRCNPRGAKEETGSERFISRTSPSIPAEGPRPEARQQVQQVQQVLRLPWTLSSLAGRFLEQGRSRRLRSLDTGEPGEAPSAKIKGNQGEPGGTAQPRTPARHTFGGLWSLVLPGFRRSESAAGTFRRAQAQCFQIQILFAYLSTEAEKPSPP